MPSARKPAKASGSRPSPHGFSIGGRAQSATMARNPLARAAMAAASPAGPPPTTTTSVSLGICMDSDMDDTAREPQSFRPESARTMHQLDHIFDGVDESVQMAVFDHQRRCDFENHEVVSADLRKDAVIPEHAHHQHLSEHARVNFQKRFERNPQTKLPRRGELDSTQQPNAADVFDHFV